VSRSPTTRTEQQSVAGAQEATTTDGVEKPCKMGGKDYWRTLIVIGKRSTDTSDVYIVCRVSAKERGDHGGN
jgi:hypothetical protein